MKPILVIQMQRMGDLILSFPLFLWLMRRYPGHPLWVAADPHFFRPLRPVGPAVRYLEFHIVYGLFVIRRESLISSHILK